MKNIIKTADDKPRQTIQVHGWGLVVDMTPGHLEYGDRGSPLRYITAEKTIAHGGDHVRIEYVERGFCKDTQTVLKENAPEQISRMIRKHSR